MLVDSHLTSGRGVERVCREGLRAVVTTCPLFRGGITPPYLHYKLRTANVPSGHVCACCRPSICWTKNNKKTLQHQNKHKICRDKKTQESGLEILACRQVKHGEMRRYFRTAVILVLSAVVLFMFYACTSAQCCLLIPTPRLIYVRTASLVLASVPSSSGAWHACVLACVQLHWRK